MRYATIFCAILNCIKNMTIKLALLKSGEDVISDIDEMITDKKEVVGYYFTNPCRAMLTTQR